MRPRIVAATASKLKAPVGTWRSYAAKRIEPSERSQHSHFLNSLESVNIVGFHFDQLPQLEVILVRQCILVVNASY